MCNFWLLIASSFMNCVMITAIFCEYLISLDALHCDFVLALENVIWGTKQDYKYFPILGKDCNLIEERRTKL